MGETWEPVTYEDRDRCRGQTEVFALLVFLTSRTRELRYANEPLFKCSLRDEAIRWSGWSLATFKRRMGELERLPGVRVARRRDGSILGVSTDALERRDVTRGRGSPVSPVGESDANAGAHQRAPRGSLVSPEGLTREPHVLSPVPTSDLPQTPSLPQRPERGSRASPAGGRVKAVGAQPDSDPSGSSSGRASPDADAGAEGFDGGVDPGPGADPGNPAARAAWLRGKAADERARGREDWARVLEVRADRLERLPT